MSVQELKDKLDTIITMGYGHLSVTARGIPTNEQGYLADLPLKGDLYFEERWGSPPHIVVR